MGTGLTKPIRQLTSQIEQTAALISARQRLEQRLRSRKDEIGDKGNKDPRPAEAPGGGRNLCSTGLSDLEFKPIMNKDVLVEDNSFAFCEFLWDGG